MSTSETITRTDLTNILNEILPNTSVDYIVEQGTTDGWKWRKWNSGRYEAEKKDNIGNVTLSTDMFTVEGSNHMWFSTALPATTPSPPHTLVTGNILYEYLWNGTGYTIVAKTSTGSGKIQLGRVASSAPTVSNVVLVYRIVDGTWK